MTFDLSAVSDSLIGLVKNEWAAAPIWGEIGRSPPGPTFTPTFTGLAPDAVRQEAGPQLSLYLYHVEPDHAREGMFWHPEILGQPQGAPTRFLPLALDLFFLLFAYSQASYAEELEAMSVALRVFHANPIVRSGPGATVPWELSLTMEHRSHDELSRLWQSTTAPIRMSQVYRASVVFIEGDTMPTAAQQATSFSVAVGPGQLPVPADYPAVIGTTRDGSHAGPHGEAVPISISPASVAAGQTAVLVGANLGVSGVSDNVYLQPPGGGTEVNVTGWARATESTTAKLVLAFPVAGGTPPADPTTPDPGVYQLRVGSGQLGSPGATRSGSTPISVAAYVNPTDGPMLTGAGPFTVSGAGFLAGATEVLVGTVALTEVTASPGPGEVSIDASGTSFTFSPPAEPAGTLLALRVRVNGIESDPALWVTV